jgi:uncharacterized protein
MPVPPSLSPDSTPAGRPPQGQPSTSSPAAPDSADLPRRIWRVWGVDFDARIVQLVVIGTVLLIFAFNNRFIQGEYDRFFLEFIVPLFIIVAVWRENPRRYFLQLGDWKLGLTVTAIGVAIMAVIIWIAGQQPDFRAYYTAGPDGRPPIRLIVDTGIDLLAWEFFFRGWLLGTLGRKYGTDAIWLQVIPFALMHVWKPEIEQLSTVVGGAFFGILAWRTHSFIYGWLLHWFMLAWILIVVTGQI